ncbi:MAG TPA: hypothetical protein VGI14_11265 [Casimicrobiaceae bacterium]
MEREQKWLRASAFGLATALALIVTMGVPAAMQHSAASVTLVDAKPLPADATQVAIEPASIHVIAVRDRGPAGRWLSLFSSHKRAG